MRSAKGESGSSSSGSIGDGDGDAESRKTYGRPMFDRSKRKEGEASCYVKGCNEGVEETSVTEVDVDKNGCTHSKDGSRAGAAHMRISGNSSAQIQIRSFDNAGDGDGNGNGSRGKGPRPNRDDIGNGLERIDGSEVIRAVGRSLRRAEMPLDEKPGGGSASGPDKDGSQIGGFPKAASEHECECSRPCGSREMGEGEENGWTKGFSVKRKNCDAAEEVGYNGNGTAKDVSDPDYRNRIVFDRDSGHLRNTELGCEKFGEKTGLLHEGFKKTKKMEHGHSGLTSRLQIGDGDLEEEGRVQMGGGRSEYRQMEMVNADGVDANGKGSSPERGLRSQSDPRLKTGKRKEINLELDPKMGDVDYSEAPEEIGSHGCQELTLSYMCDRSKPSLIPPFKAESEAAVRGGFTGEKLLSSESEEKGKDKGKQLALSMSNGTEPEEYCDRWLERDFLRLKTNQEEHRSCRIEKGATSRHLPREGQQLKIYGEEQKQKKPKTECLQLSLGLPDVSLTLASPNLDMPAAPPAQTKSMQSLGHTNHTCTSSMGHTNHTRTSSLGHTNHTRTSSFGHTNHTRTSSDGFTTSLDYSQSHTFIHNPSCSLTQNSIENYEYSVGSHPVSQGNDQVSYGNWQAPNASEQVSYGNNGLMGSAQERFKPGRDISLYQKVLQNGNTQGYQASQAFGSGNNRDWNPVGHERASGHTLSQGSFQMAPRQQASSLDGSQDKSDKNERQFSFPRELPERSRQDVWSSPSRSVSSQEMKSVQHKRVDKVMPKLETERDNMFQRDKHVWDGEQPLTRDLITADRILREIVLEPINIMAQKLQEMADNILDDVREYLQDLIGSNEKREQLAIFQNILKRRSDLTSEILIKSHRLQMEILVTLKTGIKTFLHRKQIPISELVEIFLDLRCKNLDCKSQLPVDDCECKICSQKRGFCSMCMCLICSKFDCASNTCSWVGCDLCLHWCHTACGIRMSYIKPGRSEKGGSGTREMQFHCIACDHSSEMFGFVKEVFKTCAKGWGAETLVKELDCVSNIFQGSEDPRGKQLQRKAEEMMGKLENKSCGPSEVCNSLLLFFTECDSKFSGTTHVVAKEPVQPNEREDMRDQFAIAVREAIYKINPSSSEKLGNKALKVCQTSDRDHVGKKMEATDLRYGRPRNNTEIDELESIVRIKQAEAQMFQSRADDARREASGLQRIALAKNDKIEEEYAGKLAKLCLTETEERRRKKLEELQILETAHRNYYNMKLRMETDIKELLRKMETTRRQLL